MGGACASCQAAASNGANVEAADVFAPAVGDAYAGRDAGEGGAGASEGPDAANQLPACDTEGGVTALVDNGLYVYQVAVHDSYAYLASSMGIYRVARTGGPLTLLAAPVASGGDQEEWVIAVDATSIYFSGDLETFSMPLDGGNPTPFNAPYATRIVVQDSLMYGGGPNVWSMPLDGGGGAATLIEEGPSFIYGGFAPYGGQVFATSTPPGPAEVVMAAADVGERAGAGGRRPSADPVAVVAGGGYA